MRFFYTDAYNYGRGLPLKQVHGFVLDKPERIRDALIAELGLTPDDFEEPPLFDEAELSAIHTPEVLGDLHSARAIARAVELSPLALLPTFVARKVVVLPQLRAVGGTCAAVEAAASGAWVASLSGGYHHARPGLSHGFCLVNDVAAAVQRLPERRKVLVLDLDLHQGDGNAVAFAGNPDVFTASLHEGSAFPFPKMQSDLDVELASGTEDEAYLEALEAMLDTIATRFHPDILVYVAGSDPYIEDPLGALRISKAGMLERDSRVGRFALEHGAGLVALPAGGYCPASPAINAAGFAALARMAPAA